MTVRIVQGDAQTVLTTLASGSVHCCVTSPPYWGLRDYGVDGQIGLEESPEIYIERLVEVFREVKRVLRDDGTLWLNMGDTYAHNGACGGGSPVGDRKYRVTDRSAQKKMAYSVPSGLKPKDLVGMPWALAFALRADGWYLRSDIIWHKPNPMPESVTDRPTKSHEHLFLLAKSQRYYYDADAVREEAKYGEHHAKYQGTYTRHKIEAMQKKGAVNGEQYQEGLRRPAVNPLNRNLRDVWTIPTHSFPAAHFATFPPALVEPCLKAGCPVGGTVLDPFAGAGTVGLVADRLNRHAVLIELNPAYCRMAHERIHADAPLLTHIE